MLFRSGGYDLLYSLQQRFVDVCEQVLDAGRCLSSQCPHLELGDQLEQPDRVESRQVVEINQHRFQDYHLLLQVLIAPRAEVFRRLLESIKRTHDFIPIHHLYSTVTMNGGICNHVNSRAHHSHIVQYSTHTM